MVTQTNCGYSLWNGIPGKQCRTQDLINNPQSKEVNSCGTGLIKKSTIWPQHDRDNVPAKDTLEIWGRTKIRLIALANYWIIVLTRKSLLVLLPVLIIHNRPTLDGNWIQKRTLRFNSLTFTINKIIYLFGFGTHYGFLMAVFVNVWSHFRLKLKKVS